MDAGFWLWVPVGADGGPGEGLVEDQVDGDMLGLQRPLVLGLVEGLVEGRVDGQFEGVMLGLQGPLDVFEVTACCGGR